MNVRIIVDSTADLLPELKNRVSVVPLTVHFGEEEYIDGVTITHQEFYEKLVQGDALPSTSQATPASYEPYFQEVQKAGESAVVITLASKLSGTYQSAVIAAQEFENIYVVDSECVAIGSGLLTELAVQLAGSGMDAASIAQRLEEEKKNIRIIAMVDTLEYLKRGGRVSKTVAFAGTLLNIKPILSVAGGEIAMLGKARGTKQGYRQLLSLLEKDMAADKPVLLGYTGTDDSLLQGFIADTANFWKQPVRTTVIGSVIGTHAGPGAVAIAYFCK